MKKELIDNLTDRQTLTNTKTFEFMVYVKADKNIRKICEERRYQLYLLEQGAGNIVAGQLGHFVDAEVLHEVRLVIESCLVVNLIQCLVDQG